VFQKQLETMESNEEMSENESVKELEEVFLEEENPSNYGEERHSVNENDKFLHENLGKRPKEYPANYTDPFIVFVRATENIPLKSVKISLAIQRKYRSVLGITKVSRNKLRVVFRNREEANQFCKDIDFNEYRVYIPAAEVECYGVVHCDAQDIILEEIEKCATGKFKNSFIPPLKILESFRFTKLTTDQKGNEIRMPTNFVRVTFSGNALPDYLAIGNLLLPVELYKPKPMHCSKCQSFGHTSLFCSKQVKCANCGGVHSTENCQNLAPCQYCKAIEFHELKDCEVYKKQKRSLSRKVKVRAELSYAKVTSKGYYDSLVEDSETESEDNEPSTSAKAARRQKIRKEQPQPGAIKRRRTEIDSVGPETERVVLKPIKKVSSINQKENPKNSSNVRISGSDNQKNILVEKITSFAKDIITKFMANFGLSKELQLMILNFLLPFVNKIISKISDTITNLFISSFSSSFNG
jgi:hypothetical protein